ncbi:hypothetical protein Zmor_004510, partial [Zophobas morio]
MCMPFRPIIKNAFGSWAYDTPVRSSASSGVTQIAAHHNGCSVRIPKCVNLARATKLRIAYKHELALLVVLIAL